MSNRHTRLLTSLALLVVGGGTAVVVMQGCDTGSSSSPEVVTSEPSKPSVVREEPTFSPEFVETVNTFCGACHPAAPAEDYPKERWKHEVDQGFEFYYKSDLKLKIPTHAKVVEYYKSLAPEKLEPPLVSKGIDFGKIKWRREDGPTLDDAAPAVAHINWTSLRAGEPNELVISDMRAGTVSTASFSEDGLRWGVYAKLNNPAHSEPCDLDGDGVTELVVADLGGFLPGDYNSGRVVWLRPQADGSYAPTVLADKLGRVADVQPADFGADGDQDLVVAVFGWREMGEVRLLENQGVEGGTPTFTSHIVDERHGSIHVPVTDLNGDGRPDFLAVFGQEHETVDAFLNDGQLRFTRSTLFAAGRPNYGSSGIKLVDLDQDDDLDVLFTNGDMLDNPYVRRFHTVQWLENQGGDWQHHEIAAMPGIHRALPTDLDGDGDLDLVACALLHPETLEYYPDYEFDSVMWLEQTEPGHFERHAIEMNQGRHANLEVGDFDGDGDDDIAVGNHELGEDSPPVFSIWWNDGINE